MAGGETPKVDAPVVTDAPAPSQPTNFDPPIDTKSGGNPVSEQNGPPKVSGDENTAEPGRPGFGDQIPQIESLGSFVDKDKNGKDDKTGKPKEDSEPEVVEETDTLTPEEQADADVEVTKNGPPEEPNIPEKPSGQEPPRNGFENPDRNVDEKWKKYWADQEQYKKDKERYDLAKPKYDAAALRIKNAMQLAEKQKDALEDGDDVTISRERARYIKGVLAAASGDCDSSDQLVRYADKNPDLKPYLSAGTYMVSSSQVKFGNSGFRGDPNHLPRGLQNTLRNKVRTEDWERTTAPEYVPGSSFSKQWGTDMPDLRRYGELADFLGASDVRYRNGSKVSEHLQYRSAEIAKVMNDVRESGANLSSKDSIATRDDAMAARTLEKILRVATDDESASRNVLARGNARSLIIDPLVKHDWQGRDLIGGKVNPDSGVNKLFNVIEYDSQDATTQRAAENIAHYLSDNKDELLDYHFWKSEDVGKQVGTVNPGMIRNLEQSLSPYYADLAGYNTHKGVEPLVEPGRFTKLLSVLSTDVESATELTKHVRSQSAWIIERYGAGQERENAVRISGAMDNSLQNAVDEVISSDDDKALYAKQLELAKTTAHWEAGQSFVNGILGAVPGVGSVGAGVAGVGESYWKLDAIDVIDVSKVRGEKGSLRAALQTDDPKIRITESMAEGFFRKKENKGLRERFYREFPQYRPGVPGSDEQRKRGNYAQDLADFVIDHGGPDVDDIADEWNGRQVPGLGREPGIAPWEPDTATEKRGR